MAQHCIQSHYHKKNLIFNLNVVFSSFFNHLQSLRYIKFLTEIYLHKIVLLIIKNTCTICQTSYISVQHSLSNRLCVKNTIQVQLANYFIPKPSSKISYILAIIPPKYVLYFQILCHESCIYHHAAFCRSSKLYWSLKFSGVFKIGSSSV